MWNLNVVVGKELPIGCPAGTNHAFLRSEIDVGNRNSTQVGLRPPLPGPTTNLVSSQGMAPTETCQV